jgi:hypothetical protein
MITEDQMKALERFKDAMSRNIRQEKVDIYVVLLQLSLLLRRLGLEHEVSKYITRWKEEFNLN